MIKFLVSFNVKFKICSLSRRVKHKASLVCKRKRDEKVRRNEFNEGSKKLIYFLAKQNEHKK